MNKRRTGRPITEWVPGFKGAGYDPGDYAMEEPGGDGVADRNLTTSEVGKRDSEMTKIGREWPSEHNETVAMCDVDENGVENKPQGGHESTHADPDDKLQDELGHDWPDEPSNSGGGVAEPFGGSRWSDGGELKNGDGQDELELANESWSPQKMAAKMGGDNVNLQNLFDSYARTARAVCLEDFQSLCNAHGVQQSLDQSSLLILMRNNRDFMFYEGKDASGSYWVGKQISENRMQSDEESMGDMLDDDDRSRGYPSSDGGLDSQNFGDEDDMGDMGDEGDMLDELDGPSGNPMQSDEESMGDTLECPDCGYSGIDGECPECGAEMMSQLEDGNMPSSYDEFDSDGGDDLDYDVKSDLGRGTGLGSKSSDMSYESRQIKTGPHIIDSLKNFMESAGSLIKSNPRANQRDLAEALNHSWQYYAGDVDARSCPTNVRNTISRLMNKYPGFNPLSESEALDAPDGISLKGGDGPKIELPKPKTDMKTHGDKNLLGRHQKNNLEGTPIIQNTGKGLTGKSVTETTIRENVNKLLKHVKKCLTETTSTLRGNYKLQFAILVAEDKSTKKKKTKVKTRTKKHDSLAEALTDAEELLQLHNPKDLTFEATYFGPRGQIALKQDIPLFTIMPRGPMVSEGKALFRFKRHAELFAGKLAEEGVVSKVNQHNWGSAVQAKTNYATAARAFEMISENKKR